MFTSRKTVIVDKKKEVENKSGVKISRQESQLQKQQEANIIKTLIASDGTKITLEEADDERRKQSVFRQKGDQIHEMIFPEKVDNIFLVPGSLNILSVHSSKRKGITVILWDLVNKKKLRSLNLQRDNIDYDGSVSIACSNDFFLLHYRSNQVWDTTDLRRKEWLELRELNTFKRLAKKIVEPIYFTPCIFSPNNPTMALFVNATGFERWDIRNNMLQQIEQIELIGDIGDNISSSAIAMLTDGNTLISGHKHGFLRFWSLGDTHGKATALVSSSVNKGVFHANDIFSLVVIPDGKHIITWDYNEVTLWDISNIRDPRIVESSGAKADLLGFDQPQITDDWQLVTSFNYVIEFPQLSSRVYQSNVVDLLKNDDAKLPTVLNNIIADYLFFKPKPISARGTKRNFDVMSASVPNMEYKP